MSSRVLWTDGFQRDYRRYTGARQRAVSAVRTALRRRDELPKSWFDGKRAMKGVEELVYELKVTHGDRLLIRTRGDALCLVAMGDHDITDRYASRSDRERRTDFDTASAAPPFFDPAYDAPMFVDVDDDFPEPQWAEELGEAWLHFLDSSQQEVKSALMGKLLGRFLEPAKKPYVGLLAGGAGTGKTALLLSMALDLHEYGVPVDFRCSPEMKKYLRDHTRINIDRLTPTGWGTPHVVFLDDPDSIGTIALTANDPPAGARAVIAGYDPLQWWDDKRLSTRLDWLESLGEVHKLTTCYRQSANLIEMAQNVSRTINERSSWRAAITPIQQEREFLSSVLADYSDDLIPVKPGGRAKRYSSGLSEAVHREAAKIKEHTRWDDLPELLVLVDRGRGVKIKREWKDALQGIRRIDCDIADVRRYRGLDFPSVWIFTSSVFLRQLEDGRTGSALSSGLNSDACTSRSPVRKTTPSYLSSERSRCLRATSPPTRLSGDCVSVMPNRSAARFAPKRTEPAATTRDTRHLSLRIRQLDCRNTRIRQPSWR